MDKFSVLGLPAGSWVDSHGLYIAVQAPKGGAVVQYKSPGDRLPFDYTAHVSKPNAVTTDSLGNVYEADSAGWVNEYAQRKDVVKASCSVIGSGSVHGTAVDSLGDVFVAYYNGSMAEIVEITDFTSCFSQLLGVKLASFGGMVLDNQSNLIVCDPYNKTVDVIKPPYNSVSRHLGSGFKAPINVAINAANSRAYVVDQGASAVYVLYYPSGKRVATISGHGQRVFTAVDGSNYVP